MKNKRILWQVSCKILLIFVFILSSRHAFAVDIVSMYRGSCTVDSGVIINADKRSITYLALDGAIKELPRYEVIGIASYPLPIFPIREVQTSKNLSIPFTRFYDHKDTKTNIMATGWPISFNTEHIQLLTEVGIDHLVQRNDIWAVEFVPAPEHWVIQNKEKHFSKFLLRHPLSFEKCGPVVTPGDEKEKRINPQTILEDPITIKKFFDHMEEGYAKINDYEDRQRFYAVPQYYRNKTLLGTWAQLGSRYANVGGRQINLLPFVQDEYSEGPFGFQRVLRSGVMPLAWSMHEEPTAQVFYGLKADYIHLELFFDPTAVLIGSKYRWSKSLLNSEDDRIIEMGGAEFGFDFGYFSLYGTTIGGDIGIRGSDNFERAGYDMNCLALAGQYNEYRGIIYFGHSEIAFNEDDDIKNVYRFYKVRIESPIYSRLFLAAQYIRRDLSDNSGKKAPFHYSSVVNTVSTQWNWALTYRWTLYVLNSLEDQKSTITYENKEKFAGKDKIYPKLATGASIAF